MTGRVSRGRGWIVSLAVLATVGGCITACGRETAPPLEFAFTPPSGRPLVGSIVHSRLPTVKLVARDRESGRVRSIGEGMYLRPARPRRSEDVELWVAGCRPERVSWPPTAPVRLRAGIPVRLRLNVTGGLSAAFTVGLAPSWAGPGDAPEAPHLTEFLGAAPAGWLDTVSPWDVVRREIPFDAEHLIAEVTFSRPGPHRVRYSVYVSQGGGATSGITPPDPGVVIDVKDARDPQTIDVNLDGAELRDLAESMGD